MDVPAWQTTRERAGVAVPTWTPYENPQTFVMEIGSEELPANDLTSAIRQLRTAVPEFLAGLRWGMVTLLWMARRAAWPSSLSNWSRARRIWKRLPKGRRPIAHLTLTANQPKRRWDLPQPRR